jgi:hypothetical protein
MGMSWPLGWTEQQTLDTTIPAIETAYNGSWKGLRKVVEAVAGTAEGEPDTPVVPVSQEAVQSVFRTLAG